MTIMTGDNYIGDWDDTGTGGQACARGRHCSEADYQGNAARGPRAWCETDRAHVGDVIRDLPQVYVEVHLKLGKGQLPDGERVSGGGKEAPVPLDLEVDAFLRYMILVALTWEAEVRAANQLSNPDACGACDGEGERGGRECRACEGAGVVRSRDGAALRRACALLAGRGRDRDGHLSSLLALPPTSVTRPVPVSRKLSDLAPGTVVRIDSAGDAWQRAEVDGTGAGLEILDLGSRARSVLGITPRSRRVAVRCDGCESIGTLKQREALGGGWEAVVRCSACPQVYIGQPFELLMAREYQETLKAGQE